MKRYICNEQGKDADAVAICRVCGRLHGSGRWF
ncbi:DUF2180 family protein [Archaeoglobus sp.]